MIKKISFIVFALFSCIILRGQNDYSWKSKVQTEVLDKFITNDKAEYLVLFVEKVDLSSAENFESKEAKGQYVFDKLQNTALKSQTKVLDYLASHQSAKYISYYINNSIWVKSDIKILEFIASQSNIEAIIDNTPITYSKPVSIFSPENVVEWGIKMIKADSVWMLGINGKGVVIAGEDTGYDWTHPVLKPQYRGYNSATQKVDHSYSWHDAIHNPGDTSKKNPCGFDIRFPCDDNSHGTHTMGTMVGDDGDSIQTGVAPGAKWIGARNMDSGNGTLATYIECFQFMLAPTDTNGLNPKPAKAPHVINNSWYCSTSEGCNLSNFGQLEIALNACRSAGIVVVVSAGNFGPGCNTITGPPAFFEKAFSVGATNSVDSIANFSSRGLVLIDSSRRKKPDVTAPGAAVRSSVPNGGYAVYSGTSMAGPHVCGLVALMISANPKLAGNPNRIEEIIRMTAVPKTDDQVCDGTAATSLPNTTYGWGRIDALAAVKKVLTSVAADNIENKTSIKVYPNPFKEQAYFEILNNNQTLQLEVFDIAGKVVFIQKNISEKNTLITLSLNEGAGIHFYRLSGTNIIKTGKLIKM